MQRTFKPVREEKDDSALIDKLKKSQLKVTVSGLDYWYVITLAGLLEKSRTAGKAIVFTFTPGPFKPSQTLPEGWGNNPDAVGCTLQLKALNDAFGNLNADVFAVNTQTVAYQCGKDSLLSVKAPNLLMISDADHAIEKELKLETIAFDNDPNYKGQTFLKRLSIVIKANGEGEVFRFNGSVNDYTAATHVANISKFITPIVERDFIPSPSI